VLPRPHDNAETRAVIEAVEYDAHAITSEGLFRVTRFGGERPTRARNFLLSPHGTLAESCAHDAVFHVPEHRVAR
jgi:hypothetical protein